jgi:hypothetical protein
MGFVPLRNLQTCIEDVNTSLHDRTMALPEKIFEVLKE